jgi:hypothetical protein
MYEAFAEKLRLTLALLGCASRKDLCARFRSVNPATHCDLERLNKWIQGRAMPRATSFYDDWIKVLDLDRSSTWLMNCTPAELRSTLGAAGRDVVPLPAPERRRVPLSHDSGIFGGSRALCGVYVCYSPAWSPHFRHRLVRGSLVIQAGHKGSLRAVYAEQLVGGAMRMEGDVQLTARTLHVLVRETNGGLPLFLSFILPGPPSSVMCGVMSGLAFVANEALPSASRILAVRVPDSPQVAASNRYMDLGQPAIAEDLRALGLPLSIVSDADTHAASFFANDLDQVTAAEQSGFAALFDPLHFSQDGPVSSVRRFARA